MKYIIDTSATINLLGLDNNSPQHIIDQFFHQELCKSTTTLIAPHLLLYEFGNTLTVKHKKNDLSLNEISEAYQNLSHLDIQIEGANMFDQHKITMRAIELSKKTNTIVTHYDTSYLYLAEKYDTQILTLDKQMAKLAGKKAYK